jgi:hypothetical protein
VHPDLIGALARQHHADLLRRGRAESVPARFTRTHPPPVRGAIRVVRRGLGAIMVATGQRLLQTTSNVADLTEVRQ